MNIKNVVIQNNKATGNTITLLDKLVPFVVATSTLKEMAYFFFFSQSSNVQACGSNQVQSWLWLETYVAFLSSDLITRLFSHKVNGVGLSRSLIVLSRTPCGGWKFINCPVCMASVHGICELWAAETLKSLKTLRDAKHFRSHSKSNLIYSINGHVEKRFPSAGKL